ncbi:MAG: metal ABC transporter permease [Fibrobacterota bacterium]|nr:metal ABC transporter permease [Fibrobacterota bacterium]
MIHAYDYLLRPFLEFAFMRRALIACLAMALGCGPIGILLVLRRMSLVGDAMSHAILPGAAVGFLIAGFSLLAMSTGGFLAGLAVALLSGLVTRVTKLREDASFAAFYLISLAIGVLIVSMRGSTVDLMHMLFGSILAVDNASLLLLAGISSFTLVALAFIFRPLVVECFDPRFLRSMGARGWVYHFLFLVLVVLNLVGGFQALGTLMAVGLVMLPATAARFWANEVWSLAITASFFVFASGYAGLLFSYHANVASGPAIILVSGALYLISLFLGAQGGILTSRIRRRHLQA